MTRSVLHEAERGEAADMFALSLYEGFSVPFSIPTADAFSRIGFCGLLSTIRRCAVLASTLLHPPVHSFWLRVAQLDCIPSASESSRFCMFLEGSCNRASAIRVGMAEVNIAQ